MSGLPILHGVTRSCCALQERRRRRWINEGRQIDTPDFGCTECGAHYRWRDGYGWEPVSAADSLADMVANDPRGHISTEGHL